ncbi:DOMON-like domain-containing protein [Novosphingobium tardum]|uniref:DOMON-like domain-containing protein n=1 Tax=Novosphingobium tardum TaxID=1538021 RepID=A0ABV8RQ19_9SPHN
MATHRLIPHPAMPPATVRGVEVQWIETGKDQLLLRYRVDGHDEVVLPDFAGKGRADGLWQTTCFEMYVQGAGEPGYLEFNFSPSQRWAAYRFDDYREGMREQPLDHEPLCEGSAGERFFVQEVTLPTAGFPTGPLHVGLSAVIEEGDGTKSYWALAHPSDKPDFHHPACFTLEVPPTATA